MLLKRLPMVSAVSDREEHDVAERDLRQAADEARKAVAERPKDAAAAALLKEAVQRYAQAFPAKPRVAEPVATAVEEARRLIDEKELEQAEVLLREHLATVRNDPPAMHMMAEIAAYCGLRTDADRILDHSARIHGNDPDALVHLASTLYRIAVHEDVPELVFKAAQVFDRALQIDPVHQRALAHKAEMMVQTRGLDQGHEAYRTLIALHPQVAAYWLSMAIC